MKRSVVSKEIKEQEVKMHELLNESKLRINLQILLASNQRWISTPFKVSF